MAILIEFVVALFTLSYIACFSTFAFGSFMFAITFAKDLITELHVINECIRAKTSQRKLLKRFIKSIALHVNMKQLSAQYGLID